MALRTAVLDDGRGSETRRVQAALVSSDYFAVLGVGMARGQLPADRQATKVDPMTVIRAE